MPSRIDPMTTARNNSASVRMRQAGLSKYMREDNAYDDDGSESAHNIKGFLSCAFTVE